MINSNYGVVLVTVASLSEGKAIARFQLNRLHCLEAVAHGGNPQDRGREANPLGLLRF